MTEGRLMLGTPEVGFSAVEMATTMSAENASSTPRLDTLENECIRLREELLSARHLREVLLSAAAHDLRNPLNTLSMSLGLLKDELEQPSVDGARALSLVTRMARASSRLQGLIDNLLDASRIEAGALDVSRRIVHASVLARKAHEHALPSCKERNIFLEDGSFDSDATVQVDPTRLIDALVHVVGLFQKAAGNHARIRLDVESRTSHVAFIFRAWTSRDAPVTPPLDEASGGLAYVLAHGLVSLQGGRLELETLPDGPRVVVVLPIT
jgi:signal transduction histidine kinase